MSTDPANITEIEDKVAQQLKSQRVGFLLGAGSSYLNNYGYPLAFQLWDKIKDRITDLAKRQDTDKYLFSVIQMLDQVARTTGRHLGDDTLSAELLTRISQALVAHKTNAMRLHGFRTQAMFAHVVSALSACRAITEEDSGVMFTIDADCRRPDFRIVTLGGEQLLVEVKNCHHADLHKPYRIKSDYLTSLRKYAHCMEAPLKIAIFWSRWKLWTLVDINDLPSAERSSGICLADAMLLNEMYILGDSLLATVPPLTFRIYADQSKPCNVEPDGSVPFTISEVAFLAGDVQIVNKLEKDLAWFFILHSKWIEMAMPADILNGKLQYADFRYGPGERQQETTDQPFEMLGFLSSMISSQYIDATSINSDVVSLTPTGDPEQFGMAIPDDYQGQVLKLWRFTIHPRKKRTAESG